MGVGDEEIADVKAVSDNLRCSICMDVFLDPVFACGKPCQHVFCRLCIETALEKRARCPTCRGIMRRSNLQPHQSMSSLIDELRVRCCHGCGWTGRRDARTAHTDTCPVATLKRDSRQMEETLKHQLEERDQEIAAKRARIQELEEGKARVIADRDQFLEGLELKLAERDADIDRWQTLAEGRLQLINVVQLALHGSEHAYPNISMGEASHSTSRASQSPRGSPLWLARLGRKDGAA